jgi:alpha-L-rhamnosidase
MFASIRPHRLRCEYRDNPVGVDIVRPRLFWQLDSDAVGARQTACQILVASTLTGLAQNIGDLWDSGRLETAQTTQVLYCGETLPSLTRAWWKVRSWDERAIASEWSRPAYWETGLMSSQEWTAEWIQDVCLGGPRTTAPASYFRKDILVESPVLRARLIVTALGLYEFRINGCRVGEDQLTPGWTDYRKRVPYQVFDVTSLLNEGANSLGAVVGDGWYCGDVAGAGRQQYGDRPRLRAQLHVEFANGRQRVYATDSTWRASFGPILAGDLRGGEAYDARREIAGWDRPKFDDFAWRSAEVAQIRVACVAARGPSVRVTDTVHPVTDHAILVNGRPARRFDFGETLAGRVRLRARGPAGTTVSLYYFDHPNGPARSADHFTCRGGPGGEEWESRFALHAFRYVDVVGLAERPTPATLSAVALQSDVGFTGTFDCSNERLNQLLQAHVRGLRMNLIEAPTNYPHRQDGLAETSRAEPELRAAAFTYDLSAFLTKWLADLRDAQCAGGDLPAFAPVVEAGYACPDRVLADALIAVPWTLYLAYADTDALRSGYEGMRAFVDALERETYPRLSAASASTSADIAVAAHFARLARTLAKIAVVLDKPLDAERYLRLSERVRDALGRRFVIPAGLVPDASAEAAVLSIAFGVLSPYAKPRVLGNLVERYEAGEPDIFASPYALRMLSDNGHLELAYRLLNGNNREPGVVGDWLYSVVAGIDTDETAPGYSAIILRPRPGGGLKHARANLDSLHGRISSAWYRSGKDLVWDVRVPANTAAIAYVPCRASSSVEAPPEARYVRHTAEAAVYAVPSGSFTFHATL